MTRVDYWRDEASGTHYLSILGHAGYSTEGNDIVCAAVSTVSWTLLGFLLNAGDDIEEITHETEPGTVVVLCKGKERIDTAFEMAIIGYLQIEKQYPAYVAVNIAAKRAADSRERP